METYKIISAILILMMPFTTALLVFEQDFQDFDVGNSSWHSYDNGNPDGEWVCGNDALSGTCGRNAGTVGVCESAYQIIANEGSNKFLRMYANCMDSQNDYKYVEVKRNYTRTNTTQYAFSIKYDIKLADLKSGVLDNTNERRKANFVVTPSLGAYWTSVSTQDYWGSVSGGMDTTSEDNYTALRSSVDYDEGSENLPINSNCSISDNDWHEVIYNIYYNGSSYNGSTTTIDGARCQLFDEYSNLAIGIGEASFYIQNIGAFDMYVDNIEFYMNEYAEPTQESNESNATTICDQWSPPYYLVESFQGKPSSCDWVTTHNPIFDGYLNITKSYSYYSQTKYFDPTSYDDDIRYITMKFEANVINVTTGSTITIRLYDEDGYNFLTTYWRDSGDDLWYNEDGTGKVAYNGLPLNQYFEYMYVIDYKEDTYNIYFNGSKIVSNAEFTDDLFNLESADTIKLQSSNAYWLMRNLSIYGSDADGVALLPDEDLIQPVDNVTSWCGLFYDIDQACTKDSDCETGDCLPNGKCNSFRMTYCDEKGYTRGNKCMLAGMSYCALSSTGGVILGNFFLFLILLVVIMGITYLTLTLRRSGGA